MTNSSFSFLDAKQHLENEMTGLQQQWMSLVAHQSESQAAKKELLEREIEDRKFAIEKLEAQRSCDCCGVQVSVPETFRVSMYKHIAPLPDIGLFIEQTIVRSECVDCCDSCDLQHGRKRVLATKDEILQAVEMLASTEKWRHLTKFAYRRAERFPANLGKTGDELFQEALVRTWDGRKKWNVAAVDFFGHLLWAMKNIAYHWQKKFYSCGSALEADNVTYDTEGDEISRLKNAESSQPLPDQRLIAREEVERFVKRHGNDKEVLAVIQARLEGVTTAQEIIQVQKLTKRRYEAAQRRIHSRKSVLIIEEYDQVAGLLVRLLKGMDYGVLKASTSSEGLRLYRECGPFDVVMISYSPDQNGVELATVIRQRNRSQNIIITTTYSSEEDVVRPSELADIPILLKPFQKNELCAALSRFTDSMQENAMNHCRQKRPTRMTQRKRLHLPTVGASRLPRQGETLNATLPS
jgi:CheY-like chemotaxis protein